MVARKIVLVILAILTPVFITSSLLLYEVDTTLMNPDFFIDSFEDANVFERLPGIIGGQLSQALDEDVEDLEENELRDVMVEVMPASWVRTNMSSIIHGIFEYVKSETDMLSGSIELDSLHPTLREVLERDYPDRDIDKIMGEIPGNVDLSELIEGEDLDGPRGLSDLFESFRYLIFAIAAILIILIAIVAKGIPDKLRNLGSVLLVPGIILVLISYSSGRVIDSIGSEAGEERLFSDVLDAIASNFTGRLLTHGLIVVVVAVALITASFLISRRSE